MKANPRLFFGATLLELGMGGIATVARMSLGALAETFAPVSAATLLDNSFRAIGGVNGRCAKGHRLRYLAQCHTGAFGSSHALYDSVSTARAHPRLPFARRPYGVWIHGIEVWYGLRPDRERALRGADLVLVNSQFTLERFQSLHFPLPNAKVCLLATERDEEPLLLGRDHAPPRVLSLARIDIDQLYKGHVELIEAWPTVVSAVPDARLVIAGGGSGLETVRKLARSSPASKHIDVLGFVPEPDMKQLWQEATVFAMPSRKEGFGIVYAEAMRAGVPVIASVHDAGKEVNAHGETGYNVDLDRRGELAEALVTILRDKYRQRSMGLAGRERWRANFRRSAFDERFIAMVRDFTGHSG